MQEIYTAISGKVVGKSERDNPERLCTSAAVIPQSKSTEMLSSAAPFHQWTQFYDIYYLHFITLFMHYISSFLLYV